MEYIDVIKQQYIIPQNQEWWVNYLYHFSEAHNIVSILADGMIYGRHEAISKEKMKSDNASVAVINHTASSTKECARLYFRPKTPTQYHNEGYKPKAIRSAEINANCPIPVFLLLDLNHVLNSPDIYFVPKGMAGKGHQLQQGLEAFKKLDFYKIYHEGWYDKESEADIKEYRQSEVVKEGGIPIEPYLKCILCRSSAEKDTLLYLLRAYSVDLYEKYKSIIMCRPKLNCFYKNGVYVEAVQWSRDKLYFKLNDLFLRMRKEDEVQFTASIAIQQYDKNSNIIASNSFEGRYDYNLIETIIVNLDTLTNTKFIRLKMMFDDCVMYENSMDVREMMVV